MPERNPLFESVLRVKGTIDNMGLKPGQPPPVPFGEERIPRSDTANRLFGPNADPGYTKRQIEKAMAESKDKGKTVRELLDLARIAEKAKGAIRPPTRR
ncbi:MAG: hypothetical protein ABID84_03240 [Chloroflexota bacterium]